LIGCPLTTAAWLFVTSVSAWGNAPTQTTFTCQGPLKVNGSRVNDTCDCHFSWWDDPLGGNQIGSTLPFDDSEAVPITVEHGVLNVHLDFRDDAFNGALRWLLIAVACPSGSPPIPLPPRQPITAAPYALHTFNAPKGHSESEGYSMDPHELPRKGGRKSETTDHSRVGHTSWP
jgi:hypothetical protein